MKNKVSTRKNQGADTIKSTLFGFLKASGQRELSIALAFCMNVPENLKVLCDVDRVEGTTLFVRTKHPTVSQEILLHREEIIENINKTLNAREIASIRTL